jgi:2-C-methyl-D-erythritol 4-phosphate cytidylyltransferase
MSPHSPNPRFYALIPCAGSGSRAGSGGPKQYQRIAGQPMVMHTLAAFADVGRLALTLVAVAPGDTQLPRGATFSIAACGGSTRAVTVLNGLNELKARGALDADWVLVHDAARCLVTAAMIERLIDACAADEVGGLLAHQLADTLKREEGGRAAETLPREDKWLAQTPQMFRIGVLLQALEHAGSAVTDEAGAIEALGLKPLLVPGGAENFKVTYAGDFALAEAVLRSRQT